MSFESDFFAAGFAPSTGGEIFSQTYNLKPGLYNFTATSPTSSELDMALSITNRSGRVLKSADDLLGSYDPALTFEVKRKGKYTIDVDWSAKAGVVDSGDLEFELHGFNLDKLKSPSAEYVPIADPLTGIDDVGVDSLFNAIISDGAISKSELEGLLRDTASSDGVVTQQEFDDLRTISYNLPEFISGDSKEYLQQIFDNVVLGNPANAFWTGGMTSRSPLGNLRAGSSAEQMDKLVDKWFLGLDLPNPTLPGDAARGQPDFIGDYKTASGPLFGDVISYTDVNQGSLGDCWFLAAAASVASYNPERIRDIFIDNGDGTYGVAFNEINPDRESEGSAQHWVTVNTDFPTYSFNGQPFLVAVAGSTARTLDGIMWPALLEKAAAQASEIGIFANARPTGTANAYFSIAGGWDEGLAMLEPTSLSFAATIDELPSEYKVSPFRYKYLSSRGKWDDFVSDYEAIYNSGGGTAIALSWIDLDKNFNIWDGQGRKTMVSQHALAVVDYSSDQSTFTIYNPWGLAASEGIVPFNITSNQAYDNFLEPSRDLDGPSGFSVAT